MKYSGAAAVVGKVRIHAHVDQYCRVCGCNIEYYLNELIKVSDSHIEYAQCTYELCCFIYDFECLTEHTVSTNSICY